MKKKSGMGFFFVALMTSCVAFAQWQQSAMLTPVNFNIVSQRVDKALEAWAVQTGCQVLIPMERITQSDTTPIIKGEFTPEGALKVLLARTELKYRFINARTVVVDAVDEAARSPDVGKSAGAASPPSAPPKKPLSNSKQGSDAPQEVAEVLVTARRRAENVQEVPISMAVVTASEIDQRGLSGAEDYLRGMPGVSQIDGANGQAVIIRGIETSTEIQNFGSGPATASYFGETPTTNTGGLAAGTNIDIKLVDIARVEVLRGPQGTAFGDSSMGGAVRTVPVEPNPNLLEGKVSVGDSQTSGTGGNNYNVEGVINLPILENRLAIRAVGYEYHDSGYYQNRAGSSTAFQTAAIIPFGGQAFAVDKNEVGDTDVFGGRFSALLQATDDLRFALTYLYQKSQQDGMPVANSSGTYQQTMYEIAPQHVVRGQTQGVSDNNIQIINPTVDYNLGWGQVIGTYSYTKSDGTVAQPYQVYGFPWPFSYYGDGPHSEHLGEIRLTTNLTGPWNFLLGVFAEKIDDDAHFNYLWFGDPLADFFAPGQDFVGDYLDRRSLKQRAVYGEVNWQLLPGLTLTGGARYYHYDRTVKVDESGPLFGGASSTTSSGSASGTSPRANLEYKINPESIAYVGWSRGFRLGKPQPGLPTSLCDPQGTGFIEGTEIPIASTKVVNSDTVNNYELGSKLSLLDRRLTIDADIFRMNWSGIPITVHAPARPTGCALTYVANAGQARSDGFELQVAYQIDDAWRLDLGGSWVHARLTQDLLAEGFHAGDRLPGSPEATANFGLQYGFRVGGYNAFVRADTIYVGSFFGDVQQSSDLETNAYVKLDATARIEIGKLNVDLVGRNLTNNDAFTFRGATTGVGEFFGYRLRPRTVGVQLAYSF